MFERRILARLPTATGMQTPPARQVDGSTSQYCYAASSMMGTGVSYCTTLRHHLHDSFVMLVRKIGSWLERSPGRAMLLCGCTHMGRRTTQAAGMRCAVDVASFVVPSSLTMCTCLIDPLQF